MRQLHRCGSLLLLTTCRIYFMAACSNLRASQPLFVSCTSVPFCNSWRYTFGALFTSFYFYYQYPQQAPPKPSTAQAFFKNGAIFTGLIPQETCRQRQCPENVKAVSAPQVSLACTLSFWVRMTTFHKSLQLATTRTLLGAGRLFRPMFCFSPLTFQLLRAFA